MVESEEIYSQLFVLKGEKRLALDLLVMGCVFGRDQYEVDAKGGIAR